MVRFRECKFEDIKEKVCSYFKEKDILVDSFFDQNVAKSNFYHIEFEGDKIGFLAICEEELITLFHVDDKFSYMSQEIFMHAKHLESVSECFAATGDEELVSLCMDSYKDIIKQAYFCRYPKADTNVDGIEIIEAVQADKELIEKNSGDFFDDIELSLREHQLYIIRSEKELVGFGIIEHDLVRDDFESIGMFVLEDQRRKGYGSKILKGLAKIVRDRGNEPISGCWYYNHNSLKTQFSAGAYCTSRLLRFKF